MRQKIWTLSLNTLKVDKPFIAQNTNIYFGFLFLLFWARKYIPYITTKIERKLTPSMSPIRPCKINTHLKSRHVFKNKNPTPQKHAKQ